MRSSSPARSAAPSPPTGRLSKSPRATRTCAPTCSSRATKRPGPTLSPTRWQRWLGRLTLNEWTLLAAVAVWLWLLLLAVLQWRPALKPALRAYVLSLAILAGLLCACAAATLRETRFTRTAIVITRDAVVRYGPLAESPAAFTVHDGAELRVLDQKDEWLQVSAGPRRVGWLRRDQALVAGR